MDLLTSKLISLSLLGILSLFFGLIPLKVQKRLMRPTGAASVEAQRRQRRRRELIVSCLLCFGAGVLMATVFLHMLPETRESVEIARKTARKASEAAAIGITKGNGTRSLDLKLGFNHDHGEHGHDHGEHGHDHDEHGHDHGEHGHVHKRSVNSSLEAINSNVTVGAPASNTSSHSLDNKTKNNVEDNNNVSSPDDHSHDHADHSHDHADHSHHHDDHSHDHADHSHDHGDHSHDHGDHSHHHDDHSHDHAGHSHDHADHSHDQADHSHDHADHDHSHNDQTLAPTTEILSTSSTVVASADLLEGSVTANPAIKEEIPHDHDHTEHGHSGHLHEGHNEMTSSTPASEPATSSTTNVVGTTETTSVNQPHRDHSGHLHDHELTHGPYDRTHDNLEHILKPSSMDDSRSLSFVPHDHGGHDHSHGDQDHNQSSHGDHDHEGTNARIQELSVNNLDNNTQDGHDDHGHGHASPTKVHVHDDHHDHHDHHEHGEPHPYPIAELFICLGFFFIYFVEEIIHKVVFHQHQRTHSKRDAKGGAGSMVLTNRNSSLSPNKDQKRSSSITSNGVEGIFRPTPSAPYSAENGHVISNGFVLNGHDTNAKGELRNGSVSTGGRASVGELPPRSEWGTTGVDNPVFAVDGEMEGSQMASIDYTNNSNPGHGHSHMVDINKLKAGDWVSSLRSLIVVVALSFHAVFEGLAVGLQQQIQDVWYLFYAIAAHKLVIAFCVGLELIAGGTRTALTVVYMVVFALVTPLGIAIGIIITEGTDEPNSLSHRWTLTVLQGLAGGTILYVTFCEVLERERGRKEGRFLKLAALAVGFATMAIIEGVGSHKHSH